MGNEWAAAWRGTWFAAVDAAPSGAIIIGVTINKVAGCEAAAV